MVVVVVVVPVRKSDVLGFGLTVSAVLFQPVECRSVASMNRISTVQRCTVADDAMVYSNRYG